MNLNGNRQDYQCSFPGFLRVDCGLALRERFQKLTRHSLSRQAELGVLSVNFSSGTCQQCKLEKPNGHRVFIRCNWSSICANPMCTMHIDELYSQRRSNPVNWSVREINFKQPQNPTSCTHHWVVHVRKLTPLSQTQ